MKKDIQSNESVNDAASEALNKVFHEEMTIGEIRQFKEGFKAGASKYDRLVKTLKWIKANCEMDAMESDKGMRQSLIPTVKAVISAATEALKDLDA